MEVFVTLGCEVGSAYSSELLIKTHLPCFFVDLSTVKMPSLIIYDIMNELEGRTFSPQDLDDGRYRNCLCFPPAHDGWFA